MAESQHDRELIAFRAPVALAEQVRVMARAEGETIASIYRRLLRTALQTTRQSERADRG